MHKKLKIWKHSSLQIKMLVLLLYHMAFLSIPNQPLTLCVKPASLFERNSSSCFMQDLANFTVFFQYLGENN